MTIVRMWILLIISVFVGLSSIVFSQNKDDTGSLINQSVPMFSHPDLEGELVDLNGFKGRVVLLNFWATWCSSCVSELPHLEAIHKKFGDRVAIVSVAGFRENLV